MAIIKFEDKKFKTLWENDGWSISLDNNETWYFWDFYNYSVGNFDGDVKSEIVTTSNIQQMIFRIAIFKLEDGQLKCKFFRANNVPFADNFVSPDDQTEG